MFRRRRPVTDPVRLEFEGREVIAARGDSVAAALLAAGVARFHDSAVSASPRAPLCLIGQCFECLVEIDGEPNRQACRVEVEDGMRVCAQSALARGESGDEP